MHIEKTKDGIIGMQHKFEAEKKSINPRVNIQIKL